MAQMSSQEVCPTKGPCVRQSQAMSHARKVMASTKFAYARGSSFARVGTGLVKERMRGRGRGRVSFLVVVVALIELCSLWRGASGL